MKQQVQDSGERIISLAPSVTSILVSVGARSQLVGVTKWCAQVADVRGLPRLGDCWAGDMREVLRHKPTLIIGSVPYKTETVAELLKAPCTFVATNPRTLADIWRDIRQIGRLAGRPKEARGLVERMQKQFARTLTRTRNLGRPLRVYSEAWPKPRITSPVWVAELIEIAGGNMCVPAGKIVSDDDVVHADPEVIVLAWAATGSRSKRSVALLNSAWKNVSAVRAGHVFVVRDELLNTPGPPLLQGIEELDRILRHVEKGNAGNSKRSKAIQRS